MAENLTDIAHAEDYVDESGWTSQEPENLGHPGAHGGGKAGAKPETKPDDHSEGNLSGGENLERGLRPVEGDGDGAPISDA